MKKQIGKGRKRIIIDAEINRNTILDVLQKAWAIHLLNVNDMKYLIDYYKGRQDIENREPSYTSGINEKVTLNYAYSSVRDIVGYTFGKPTQLIQRKVKNRKDLEKIADILEYENSSLADHETATLTAITGIGYLCTLPTEEVLSDYMPAVPVKINSLDNLTTFCVQSPIMGNPVILSCTYYSFNHKTYFLCFTDTEIYKIECDGKFSLNSNAKIVDYDINPIGLNPITMVQNNQFLMGDFETATSVLNALNLIASDSVNDVENVIQSLLVIINAELNKENVDKVKKNKKDLVLNSTSVAEHNIKVDGKRYHIDYAYLTKDNFDNAKNFSHTYKNITVLRLNNGIMPDNFIGNDYTVDFSKLNNNIPAYQFIPKYIDNTVVSNDLSWTMHY